MKQRWPIVHHFDDEEPDFGESPSDLTEAMRQLEGVCGFCGHSGHQESVCEIKYGAYSWSGEGKFGGLGEEIERRRNLVKVTRLHSANRKRHAEKKTLR